MPKTAKLRGRGVEEDCTRKRLNSFGGKTELFKIGMSLLNQTDTEMLWEHDQAFQTEDSSKSIASIE